MFGYCYWSGCLSEVCEERVAFSDTILFAWGLGAMPGYLESSPDSGCQFPASISPKNTEEMSKIILFNEYDESEWASLMPKHDNFQIE